jgi:hypothetical protein
MDPSKRDELVKELIITLLTTGIILAMYWLQEMPEWKREALIMELKSRFQRARETGLSLAHRAEIEKFRQEISAYEHEMRRKNAS